MKLKSGVIIEGLKPEILIGVIIANDTFSKLGHELVITAGLDGVHMKGSKHYIGQAVDIRSRDILPERLLTVFAALKMNLGANFDVVKEDTHIHVEFDPKVGK